MKKTVKSGKIEFYRFIFCLGVLFFHMGKYFRGEPSLKDGVRFEFFPHGSIGVEFFFLISGFFMARSIYKKILAEEKGMMSSNQTLSVEYLTFMKHKYLRILPEHIPMFLMTFLVYVMVHPQSLMKIVVLVMKNIPSFLLIQMSGINLGNVLHIEWYISSMLLTMAVLYPICRKYYYTFTRYFAPLIGLFILGYMQETTKSLTGVSVWMGVCYKSTLRALVEVALGTTCFEASRFLTENFSELEKKWKVFWTLVEAGCFGGSVLFVMTTMGKNYEVLILGLFFVMIALATSGISYGAEFFDRQIFYFLGKISFSVYLGQLAAIYIVMEKMKDLSFRNQILIGVGLTTVFVVFTEICSKPLTKWINKIEKK